ncbi:MAG: TolC family protein [Verrucomicrobiales bacterium]|nr:TolC family protein [Verrucomicrobiota bacterium JB025]
MIRYASVLLGVLAVSACSTTSRPDGRAPVALESAPVSAAIDYPVASASGPADLAWLAVRHHPSLKAARHRAERLAQKAPQERSLPDPVLEVSAGSMAETAAGRVDGMGGVKQKIPFPGKRSSAAAAADSEAAAAREDVMALELKLTEQVHAAWWDLYLAEETIRISRENRTVLEDLRGVIDARVAADEAAQADQLRLAGEISLVDRDIADADRLRGTARARLNSLLNRPAGASLPSAARSRVPSAGSLDSLLAAAEANHPEVTAAQRRADAFRHRLKRAELEKFPDFTAGVVGASVSDSGLSGVANGRDQVYATLGINIPLWQEPRRAMIREAREGISETESMVAAARSDLRYRVEDAWYRAKTAREVVRLFETRLIPDARQAYEVTLAGYSSGKSTYTDLMETWQGLLGYRLQLAKNRALVGKATATLRAAAGIR